MGPRAETWSLRLHDATGFGASFPVSQPLGSGIWVLGSALWVLGGQTVGRLWWCACSCLISGPQGEQQAQFAQLCLQQAFPGRRSRRQDVARFQQDPFQPTANSVSILYVRIVLYVHPYIVRVVRSSTYRTEYIHIYITMYYLVSPLCICTDVLMYMHRTYTPPSSSLSIHSHDAGEQLDEQTGYG
jgi:hypothetical protein